MRSLEKWCAAMIMAAGMPLAAQVVISGQVNYQGTSVPYAPIQVCAVTSTGTPCLPTSSIYSDYNLAHIVSNPNTADSDGNYTFYAANLPAPSFYVVQVTPIYGTVWSYVQSGAGWAGGPFLPLSGGTLTGALNGTSATFSGSVAAGTVTGQKIGAVYQADQFAGADASVQINACIAAVIAVGGGTCDASGLGGAQTLSEQINVGSEVQANSATNTVTLILPDSGNWTISIADGTSCGIMQYSNTTIMRPGEAGGGGGNRIILGTTGSTRISSVYCTDPNPTSGGSYIRAGGFWFGDGVYSNTRTGPVFNIQKIYDESHFHDMGADVAYGDVWNVASTCCGTSFDHIQGFAGDGPGRATGGYPLHVLGGNNTITFRDSTFNGPGAGKNNILVDGANVYSVTFDNVYEEKYTTDPAPANLIVGATNISFIHTTAAGTSASYCWENDSLVGFSVRDSSCVNGLGAINDTAFGRTVPAGYTAINYTSTNSHEIHLQESTDESFLMTPNSVHVPVLIKAVSFTPTAIGWYRLMGPGCQSASGTVTISGTYDNHVTNITADYTVQQYGQSSLLTVRNLGQYAGGWLPVDEIEVSSDGATAFYLDIHINDATVPSPITAVFSGQGSCPSGIVNSPVVGAVPGSSTVSLINLNVLPSSASFATSGDIANSNAVLLPHILTGYHGTSGTKVQLSDGTGTSGNYAKFASDGSITDGPESIADTTLTVGTGSVAANSCNTISTLAMTGLTTSMTVTISPSSDISAVAGWSPGTSGQLYFIAWPSAANTLSYYVCNPTGSALAPGSSTTWNVGVR